ncbi:prenyltransferase/squalene oxidase repeat-containing protein [Evansella sp. AB-P1]|uniref:terpene cyclase/mutase family protein n=1 Tax=Evansella sp. AB-P1 TaxID=3037653 RepID=UPI00241CB38C|nr:prenyltransferase/squalene oxidase repeat-containing protein [Evansella sp. AB-P1]MDG5787429.1 prenyltransferase/squalene oxidase repeat-containing protein [Evansella sp. AB-P1]
MEMDVQEKAKMFQQELISRLRDEQLRDGSWRYPCENGPITDAYTIIVLRVLNRKEDEGLIKELSQRLIKTQSSNGAWKLYGDEEEGNLSATIEAYTALLFSRVITKEDNRMKKAEKFIMKRGGLKRCHVSTKFMLALNGLYPWPLWFPIPTSSLLLPKFIPGSFYRMTSYVKVHLASVLIAASKRFTVAKSNEEKNETLPSIDHLIIEKKIVKRLWKQRRKCEKNDSRNFDNNNAFSFLGKSYFRKKAWKRAEEYILNHIEKDGTLGSYVTASIYMIYSLLALGYDKKSPIIVNGVKGIIDSVIKMDDYYHVENAKSNIWDTALMTYTMQEAGVLPIDEVIHKASNYLMKYQQSDWGGGGSKDQKNSSNGPWSFSTNNTSHPDIDDTQAALRAIQPQMSLNRNPSSLYAWNQGIIWLLSMQNKDGGWGSFEKNKHRHVIARLPIPNTEDTVIDPSTADLTGRTLQFLGEHVNLKIDHPKVAMATKWLLKNQEKNGSWYGRWGVCYIYGTWAAVTGLMSIGIETDHPAIVKAKEWLLSIQGKDGGWGESCKSDIVKKYTPLPYGTPSQTAWAVDALIAIEDKETIEIEKGIKFLVEKKGNGHYPTGGGLPGSFYIHYHSYKTIWPLLVVSHYLEKYGPKKINSFGKL